MANPRLLILALCWTLSGCGARSALLAFDEAGSNGSAPDAATPDAAVGCVHPPVVAKCKNGWCIIPAGCFTMGSPTSEPCREPPDNTAYGKETQHEVTVTRAFEIQRYEATSSEFEALMGWKPDYHPTCGTGCPANGVRWGPAAAYCNALSQQRGLASCYVCSGAKWSITCQVASAYAGKAIYDCPGYRLPTEAEWEYAYRAGTSSAFYSGPAAGIRCDGCVPEASLDGIGWYCDNAKAYPYYKQGGVKAPNGWGLYDMAGNVWEWCHDGFVNDLGAGKQIDPVSNPDDGYHVHRGGAASYPAKFARAAARGKSSASSDLGVRCARTLP